MAVNISDLEVKTTEKKKPSWGSKIAGFGSKALDVWDKPQQFIQSKLAPTLFGTKTYEQGFNKLGLNPGLSKGLALGSEMILDPTNLIPVGALAKGVSKLGKTAKNLEKVAPVVSKIGDFGRLGEVVKKGTLEGIEKTVRKPGIVERFVSKIQSFDKAFVPMEKVLERTPVGAKLSTKLYDLNSRTYQTMGLLLKKIRPVLELPQEKLNQIYDFRKSHGTLNTTQDIKIASRILTDGMAAIKNLASDLNIGKFGDNKNLQMKLFNEVSEVMDEFGIPKDFDPEFYMPQRALGDLYKINREQAIPEFAKLNNISKKSAEKVVDSYIEGRPLKSLSDKIKINYTKAGHLEKSRVWTHPDYVLDKSNQVLAEYIHEVSRRLTQTAVFGNKNQELVKYFDALRMERPDDADWLIDGIKREMGLFPSNMVENKQLSWLRKLQTTTSLGLTSTVSNMSQSVNSATTLGFSRILSSLTKTLGNQKETRELAEVMGITAEASIRDILHEGAGYFTSSSSNTLWGKADRFFQKITAPGFGITEKFNRRVPMNASLGAVVDNFEDAMKGNKKALGVLKELDVNVADALKRGSLNENDIINAARKAVSTTQFNVNPMSMPYFFSTPYGKVLLQFKSFSFKQGQFILEQVLQKAVKEKDFMPLMRYLWLGNIVGNAVTNVRSFITGRERETDPFKKIAENISAVGGAGMPQDALRALQGGTEQTLKWIVGPTVSDIATLGSTTGQALAGEPKPLGRFILGNVPTIGSKLNRTLLPTDKQKKSLQKPLQPSF